MGSFPYHSHIFRDSYGSGMGIVWEAYHKGVPLLGVPENPIDNFNTKKNHQTPPVLIDQVARCPKSFHDLKPWLPTFACHLGSGKWLISHHLPGGGKTLFFALVS